VNIQDAIDVIESVSGFTDESTPVGEAWLEVLSFIHCRPTAQPEPSSLKEQALALVNSNKPYLDDTAMDIIRRALETQ